MQIAKWGNSLAVRLPKKLVEELDLKEGDEIGLVRLDEHQFGVQKRDKSSEFFKAMQAFNWPVSKDYKFDRDEANER